VPAVRLIVRGRVQGVGFRWFVRERAQRDGLAGWVRNMEDGGVEIAAAADADALERFVEVVRRGPPGARVDLVERSPLAAVDALDHPFAVRH
jgi:acylphosphatase